MVPAVDGVAVVDVGGVAVVGLVPAPGVMVPVPGVVPPTGGVVPGVALGVVPGVVVGVVPGVVLGVVGDTPVLPTPVVGGQSDEVRVVPGILVVVLGAVPGEGVMVPVELVVVPVDGVIVPVELGVVGHVLLCTGFVVVEVGDGSVPDVDGDVVGEVFVVVGMAGVVPCCEELPVAVPGAVVVGMLGDVPPAPVVCAAATPTQRQSAAVSVNTRVIINISPELIGWDGARQVVDAYKPVLGNSYKLSISN
ncbi:MAG: hypothetical protein ACRD3E_20000 [Terriglobales bacterium]